MVGWSLKRVAWISQQTFVMANTTPVPPTLNDQQFQNVPLMQLFVQEAEYIKEDIWS